MDVDVLCAKSLVGIFRNTVIKDDDFRRAKTLLDKLTDEEITGSLPDDESGEFPAFVICKRLFVDQPIGARVVQSLLQRILKIPNIINKQSRGISITDLVVIHSRSDVIYQVLSVADVRTFSDPGRTSCLIYLLAETLETTKQLRGHVVELLQKLLVEFKVNPNLEICNIHPIRIEPIEPYSLNDPVFSFLKSRGFLKKSFINYVGYLGDTTQEYRNRIRQHLLLQTTSSKSRDNKNKYINMETLFSIYLRNANNYRHRASCVDLILSGRIDMKTILFIKEFGSISYQSLIFKKPLKMISQVGGFLFSQTPAYFFYVPSAGDPLKLFFQAIATGWEGYISVSTKDFKSVIVDIFNRRLVRPEVSLVKKYIAHGGIFRDLKKLSSRGTQVFNHLIIRDNPENTGLAKILLTPHCLERFILNKTPLRELIVEGAREQYNFLKRKNSPRTPQPLSFINETFFVNEEDVKTFNQNDPCTFFVSEGDSYAFRLEEFPYLIDKQQNPYNRRKLHPGEIARLLQLVEDYKDWWFIYPLQCFELDDSNLDEEEPMVTEIDEMLNQSPFFMYGERLRPHLPKLSKPGVIRFLHEQLLINSDSCIPFQTVSADHSSIEEINICYGILVPRMSSTRLGVNIFIQWIYLILDSTRFHSRETLYEGRLICLYNTIMNHLKNYTL